MIPENSFSTSLSLDMNIDSTDHITLRSAQKVVDSWIRSTGAGYFSELTNMAILTEETGEVARIIARRFGDQTAKQTDVCTDGALADELADVVWTVMALANQTGIDLADAFAANFAKKQSRDCGRHSK